MKLERTYNAHVDVGELAWFIYRDKNIWRRGIHPLVVESLEAKGETSLRLCAMEFKITVTLRIETPNWRGSTTLPLENCFKHDWEADDECEKRNETKKGKQRKGNKIRLEEDENQIKFIQGNPPKNSDIHLCLIKGNGGFPIFIQWDKKYNYYYGVRTDDGSPIREDYFIAYCDSPVVLPQS